jgi:hypothetical protein
MEMIEWFAEENARKGGTTTLVEFKPNWKQKLTSSTHTSWRVIAWRFGQSAL